MNIKLMIFGIIISVVSVFFIHNYTQNYWFLAGCIVFIVGLSLKYKDKSEKNEHL